jgi:hypothetical protein
MLLLSSLTNMCTLGITASLLATGTSLPPITMRVLSTTAALLLLATALTLAASPAAAQKNSGDPAALPQCRFGWVPISFDKKPWIGQPLDPRRRPKLLNLRCTEACRTLGLQPVLTGDADASLQKPLCYFERKRMLGATYKIYGSW